MGITVEDLWAKTNPYESLESHMLKSGLFCKELLLNSSLSNVFKVLKQNVKNIDEKNLLNFICYIVAMHDIGKASPFFQSYNKEMRDRLDAENLNIPSSSNNYLHEAQSVSFLYSLVTQRGINDELLETLGEIINNHHARRQGESMNFKSLSDYFPTTVDIWLGMVKQLEEKVYTTFSYQLGDELEFVNRNIFFHLLWGILVVSDWTSSTDNSVLLNLEDCLSDSQIINLRLKELGFITINKQWKAVEYNKLLANNLEMRPIQTWTHENFQHENNYDMMFIEAGTGEGKTSTGLYSALKMMGIEDGFYYALPMKVMVEAKYKELKELFKEDNLPLQLLHGSRLLLEDLNNSKFYLDTTTNKLYDNYYKDFVEISDFLQDSSKKGLLHSYTVGTIDQLLHSVLPNKYYVLHLLGLVGKVLILDEIHSYDEYTSTLICCLLSWCKALGVKVIIMSATMRQEWKQLYIDSYLGKNTEGCLNKVGYPLVTLIKADGEVEEHEIKGSSRNVVERVQCLPYLTGNNCFQKQAQYVKSMYEQGCNCVVYKNTIGNAQSLYEECIQVGIAKEKILISHTFFTLGDRHQKEEQVLKYFGKDISSRPSGFVVICTQVFEACLDMDFDVCFSDLAPIDILIQRWGRKCRFNYIKGNKCRGTNIVFVGTDSMDFDFSEYIYYPLWLHNTYNLLMESNNGLEIPGRLREYIKTVYTDRDLTKEEKDLFNNKYPNTLEYKIKTARNESINLPFKNEFYLTDRLIRQPVSEDSRLAKKPRLIQPTKTFILLDKKEVIRYNLNKVNLSQYRTLMKHSLTVSESKLHLSTGLSSSIIEVTDGLLKGCYILPMTNNVCTCADGGVREFKYTDAGLLLLY